MVDLKTVFVPGDRAGSENQAPEILVNPHASVGACNHLTASSSSSKISVAFGQITGPLPYVM
jgi:hypothetical protein